MDNHFTNMKFLDNVKPENSFILNNGFVIKSIPELANVLDDLDEGIFDHHVTSDRNDFANWVEHCIGDSVLVNRIREISTKDAFVDLLNTRIEEIIYNKGEAEHPELTEFLDTEDKVVFDIPQEGELLSNFMAMQDVPPTEQPATAGATVPAEQPAESAPVAEAPPADMPPDVPPDVPPDTPPASGATALVQEPAPIEQPAEAAAEQPPAEQPVEAPIETPAEPAPEAAPVEEQPTETPAEQPVPETPAEPAAETPAETPPDQSQEAQVTEQPPVEEKPAEAPAEPTPETPPVEQPKEEPKPEGEAPTEIQVEPKAEEKPVEEEKPEEKKEEKPADAKPATEKKVEDTVEIREIVTTTLGYPELDNLMKNGVPRICNILFVGMMSTGKTSTGLKLLLNTAKKGEKALYISFQDSEEKIINVMKNLDSKILEYVNSGNIQVNKLDPFEISKDCMVENGEGHEHIEAEKKLDFVEIFKPKVIVVDSLSALELSFSDNKMCYRKYVDEMFKYFEKRKKKMLTKNSMKIF